MFTPVPGEVIAGRYRLEREIARGGMGSVWAGRDDKLRRKVAVKLVVADWKAADDAQTRFEREATAVAQLASPHIVQVFDYGVERGSPFIVMELLEGEDLRARLQEVKRMSLEVTARILVQTAKALSVAHSQGVVHRDLKPGNIFLVRTGEEEIVKVLDFGVAKRATTNLLEGGVDDDQVMGTPQFMSPEQARGLADLDHRADLWSLGVIVYKALTGKLPFAGSTPTSVIVKVCTADPILMSKLAPDLPKELDAFFARALARDRERRFGSAREMAMAFSRITPITFTTLSMPDRAEIDAAIAHARQLAHIKLDDDEAETLAVGAFVGGAEELMRDLEELRRRPLGPNPLPPPSLPGQRNGNSSMPPTRMMAPGGSSPSSAPPTRVAAGAAPPRVPPPPPPRRPPPPPPSRSVMLRAAPGSVPEAAPSQPLLLSQPATDGSGQTVVMPNPDYTPDGVERHRGAAPVRERPTWLLAVAAIAIGVVIAIVASALHKGEPEVLVLPANPVPVGTTAASPTTTSQPTPSATAAPSATVSASSTASTRPPPVATPRPTRSAGDKPPPPDTATPPPPPPPPPTKTAPPPDPFADRL